MRTRRRTCARTAGGRKTLRERAGTCFPIILGEPPQGRGEPGGSRRRRINVDKYCGRDRRPNVGCLAAVAVCGGIMSVCVRVCMFVCVRWVYRLFTVGPLYHRPVAS
uniref:Uncharacterized protein n=1 Tax=Sipha flava TaxID=143950 RepID=A0A2S2R0H8_9HEMI